MDADRYENPIGAFLRARREQVRPEDVGLHHTSPPTRRRVPGLRREELALLAGVSADYYVRLEQGRDHRPSPQVLDALARALRLDEEATLHLHALATPAPARRRPRARPERVRPGVQRMLESWPGSPAMVVGRRLDILVANDLATTVNPAWAAGENLVRGVFLDAGALYPDHARVARDVVASLRASVGTDLDDPLLHELVGELSLKSELFRKLWARHEIREKADGVTRLAHPLVGELELRYETFTVNAADGQMLLVYCPEADSPSKRALTLLSSMAAGLSPRDGSRPLPPSAQAPERAPSDPTRDAPSR